ncbi:hypothetical protein [Dactylosporangium darangshiense]|uniref:Uncharacterized protein n=1 Tax=Dactylosporangium darangshiense TaxID=579108 RepID=A0ABP8D9J5_9ACTN
MSGVAAFGALLDRSVARIGELAADGRDFDRQGIAEIADIWDNNLFPLFAVALTRPRWIAEWRARAALRWMADLGPSRRAWMIEQAAIAGHRLEPLLGPPVERPAHFRDYRGEVRATVVPLTESVAEDYDLDRATVRTVRVERHKQGLAAYLALASPRRFEAPGYEADAIVELFLQDVRTAEFDSDDAAGVSIGQEIRIGENGRFRAGKASVGFDDMAWHLSRAGRAADAAVPRGRDQRRERRPVQWRLAGGAAGDAALVLRQAMLEIRSVRYSRLVGEVPVRELCEALAGAGAKVLAGGSFRELAEGWVAASPVLADRVADLVPDGHWARTAISERTPRPDQELPNQAQLTLASYTAAHDHYGLARDATAIVNLAVPDGGGPWAIRALEFERPGRVTFTTAAFTEPHPVEHAPGRELTLGANAFRVTG